MWNSYGPTVARPPDPTDRSAVAGLPTIDIHAHVAIREAALFAAPHLDPATIPLAHFASDETRALNKRQEADRATRMGGEDPARIADLDAAGIAMQLVMPPPPQCYYTVPLEIAVPASRMVNDGLAAFAARRPDRYVALGTVPLADGPEAARELERAMGLGLKGVQILTTVAGREISEEALAPFWAAAERLGALVVIHPNGFTEGTRLTEHYLNNTLGNPLETTIALHRLILDGVLERHPGLKLLAVHGGGFLGSYVGRIDHAWGARSDGRAALPRPPTSYLKQVFVDTVVFTPAQLRGLVEFFGADHVLMGTDYPFDMAEADPIGHVLSAGLSSEDVAAIVGGNARRLLGFG